MKASFVQVLTCLALTASATTTWASAPASDFPSQPIRLMVPFSAGGGTDILSRTLAKKMSENMGASIVVENRAGGNTLIATEALAQARPDGHTLLMQTNNFVVNPTLYKDLSFDTVNDFVPVSLVARHAHVLVVNQKVPAKSFSELVQLAQEKPGHLTFASAGSGTVNHLSGELLKTLAGIEMVHVPYKGSGLVMPDLLAGRVDMQFAAMPVVSGYVADGRLRPLAVTTKARSPRLPDVPTIAELGYPDYDFSSWFGVLAPAGTPPEVIKLLNEGIVKALQAPEVKERLADYELIGSSPEEFAAFIKTGIKQSANILKASGAGID